MTTPPITVYTNVGWGPCHRATEYLSRKGVPFTERNVGKDPTARQELMELGLTSLPVILIGDKRLTGFNPTAIDAALAGWKEPMAEPSQANVDKMWAYARKFAEKSGTSLHPDVSVTQTVVEGLARHIEEVGRPLCPCNFYPDPKEEAKLRRWICACEEMQKFKYCHCLLFVTPEGVPITEYLPEDHEGRQAYGVVKDPTPAKGRAVARVLEKQERESPDA